MKRTRHILIVLICILIVIPLCGAIEEEVVGPTVDIEMGIRDDDVSTVGIDFIINNPTQKEASLTGFKYYIYIDREKSPSQSSECGMSESFKPMETVIKKESFSVTGGEPLKQFLRKGFINITVNGSLLVKVGTDSFEVPFEKATTVYLESDKQNKRAICPNITGIELKTSTLESPSGEITDVFINQSIIITNPNPTTICLDTLDYKVYFKKDGKWVRLFSGFAGGGTIESMGSYRKSIKHRESDDEVIQYLLSGDPTEIKIRGSMFMYPKEKGWSPSYFESSFETVITTINGSGISGEVTPTPTPSSTVSISPTPSSIPGFEVISAIAGLLVVYLLRRRE